MIKSPHQSSHVIDPNFELFDEPEVEAPATQGDPKPKSAENVKSTVGVKSAFSGLPSDTIEDELGLSSQGNGFLLHALNFLHWRPATKDYFFLSRCIAIFACSVFVLSLLAFPFGRSWFGSSFSIFALAVFVELVAVLKEFTTSREETSIDE